MTTIHERMDRLDEETRIKYTCPKCGNEVTLIVYDLGLDDDYIGNGIGAYVECKCGTEMTEVIPEPKEQYKYHVPTNPDSLQ